jgi:hypothetical protein
LLSQGKYIRDRFVFENSTLIPSFAVNDVEEFFVPAQFFVVVTNWTEIDA